MGGGLLDAESRKLLSGAGKAFHISLTDRGWAWLSEHLDADLSSKSPAGSEILGRMLRQLKTFLEVRQLTLAEYIRPNGDRTEVGKKDDLDHKIEAAYFRISGSPHRTVREGGMKAIFLGET